MSFIQHILEKIPKLGGIWDKSFILQILIIAPFVLICIPSSLGRSKYFQGEIPSVTDLLPSVLCLAMFCVFREIFANKLFVLIAKKIIRKKPEWTEEFTKFRTERMALTLFKTIYFFIISPLGILLFRNEDWVPKQLFGAGKSDLSLLWENFPYVPRVPYLSLYYCIELGYHMHSLVYHLKLPARNDFYESLLHHLATVFLIVLSYSNCCARIGVLVMILHDVVDAWMYLAKTLMDCAPTIVFIPPFALFMGSYLYFRLYTFPVYVIPGGFKAIKYIPEGAPFGKTTWALLNLLLVVLFILHIYWFKLIIDTFTNLISKKGIVDPHATQQAVDFNKKETVKSD